MKNSILKLILASLLLVFISCNNTQKEGVKKPKNSLLTFTENFLTENPSYFNNDITIKKYDSLFQKQILDTTQFKGIDSIPLNLEGIKKVDNKYYAHFSSSIRDFENTDFDLYFDILGEVPTNSVDTLIQGNSYVVKFSPINFISPRSPLNDLSDSAFYTPTVGLRKSDFTGREIQMGVMFGDIRNIRNP